MKVKVNDKEISIFGGAMAVDAIRKYIVTEDMDLDIVERLNVYDKYGHEIDMEAPLKEGDSIKIEEVQD